MIERPCLCCDQLNEWNVSDHYLHPRKETDLSDDELEEGGPYDNVGKCEHCDEPLKTGGEIYYH